MISILIASQILSFLAIAALSVVIFALARQIGILHERLAPIGATQTQPGLEPGSAMPRIVMRTLEGGAFPIGEQLQRGARQLILFVTTDCPVCRRVIPLALGMAAEGKMELVLVGDGTPPEMHEMQARYGMGQTPFVSGPELGLVLQVSRLPFAAVVDDRGTLRAKGLVNTRAHLEQMLAAAPTEASDTSVFLPTLESAHAAV